MKFTYLLIDFFTILVPFLFSFHPKLQFYKTWKAFFPAVIVTGLLFIVWDAWFTGKGVWGFNSKYVIGVYAGNLPLEELLFFLCIPYSCVFTFFCLDLFIKRSFSLRTEHVITIVLLIISLVLIATQFDKLYTRYTFILLAVLLILTKYVFRISWLAKFYLIYLVLLIPFLIVNGLLTGTGPDQPVVWYNNNQIIGPRILTIPFEDIFYGMDLVLMNVMIYRYLLKIKKPHPVLSEGEGS